MGNPSLPNERSVIGRVIAQRYLVEAACEHTLASSSYRAQHLKLERSVLLRVWPARATVTREACRRALVVAEQASVLSNPHLGRTLDVGLVAGSFPFAIYEYSKGRSLAGLLAETGQFTLARLLGIGGQLAGALETAHAAGLVHGALTLDQLWLESLPNRPEWVRLLGFGLAELPEGERDGAISGIFRSTEQRESGPAPALTRAALRADIYAFGACLYELASGSPPAWAAAPNAASPWTGHAWTGARAVAHGLARLIQRCLFPFPDGNYQTASELRRDLERLQASAGSVASEPPARRVLVTAVHAPAPRVRVALGQPKVIVKGG